MIDNKKQLRVWQVPREWDGQTVVIIAGGPSVTARQVEYIFDKNVKVIAVNDAYVMAPWADILYAADAKWWKWHKGVTEFEGLRVGLRYSVELNDCDGQWVDDLYPEILGLANEGEDGMSSNPGFVRGKDSGYHAIQLAVQLGAARIVLLGFDMKSESLDLDRDQICAILDRTLPGDYPLLKREAIARAMIDIEIPHWHGHHPNNIPPPYDLMLPKYATMAPELIALGVQVFNCNPDSALQSFFKADLEKVLTDD